ncbi:proliferating cell nuclear antigen [Ranavirus maximus]|uniref:Proliferating cell nuclear antigen n=1 Tax=Ranavirus maximus TaxID=1887314 RepID=A0A1B2IU94_FRG3V|nr:proliferating cell nuclear antigen [Ranavirus maximus]ANZ57145.1 proliferating cell nuclear antigen [Ranavirus maximus]
MLWEAVTDKPVKLKGILELLLNNMDSARLVVTSQSVSVVDYQSNMAVTASMPSSVFTSYVYKSDAECLYAGLPHAALPDLKSFKAKCNVTLRLMGGPECGQYTMKIIIANASHMSTSINMVVDHVKKEADRGHPEGAGKPFTLTQQEFNTLCKTFKQGPVNLGVFGGVLVASGGVDGIKVKEVAFGAPDCVTPHVKLCVHAEKMSRLIKMGPFSAGSLTVCVAQGSVTVSTHGHLGSLTVTLFEG